MKQNLFVEIIAGFLKATPKRLAIARNVLIIVAALAGMALYLNNQGVLALPAWMLPLINGDGIIALLNVHFRYKI